MKIASGIWYIAKFDILKNLSKEEMSLIDKSLETKIIKKNQKIYFPDKYKNHVYFLKKGELSIIENSAQGESVKDVLKPGNVFGELEYNNEKCHDKALAVSDSLICFISIELLNQLMNQNPEFKFSIHKIAGLQVKKLERNFELLLFKDCRTRIINFLIDLAKEFGTEKRDSYTVKNFLTYNDIAKLTATTKSTVVTTIRELELKSLISYSKNQIEIIPSKLITC